MTRHYPTITWLLTYYPHAKRPPRGRLRSNPLVIQNPVVNGSRGEFDTLIWPAVHVNFRSVEGPHPPGISVSNERRILTSHPKRKPHLLYTLAGIKPCF